MSDKIYKKVEIRNADVDYIYDADTNRKNEVDNIISHFFQYFKIKHT